MTWRQTGKNVSFLLEFKEFYNIDNSKAFTDGTEAWNRTGLDLEKSIFKTTRNFYIFVFFSAAFYFTGPVVVHFLFSAGEQKSQLPLPVQV